MEDFTRDWPEPVVPVQSLSDIGATSIPSRYIKPPSERTSPDSFGAGTQGVNIPVIDLQDGLVDGVLDCPLTMHAISDACREWGFFQVVNHGVSPDLMQRMKEIWREFFHLPMEQKLIYANSPETYEGYGSRLGIQKGAILDWGDYFFLNILPNCIKNYDKWPALPTSCRVTTEEYGQELVRLCVCLMKLLSKSLGLDEEDLQKAFGGDDGGACMRMNFYPKCPQPDLALGLSAHSDPGGLTILLADESVESLQVRRGIGWVTVKAIPNSFIVNIGDQIQVLTNAVYKSVEHRVTANSAKERLSVAFFYNPRSDLPIGPVRELLKPDQPVLYEQMTFNEYRIFVRVKGACGKSQVESLRTA